jgi:hypothetical protein
MGTAATIILLKHSATTYFKPKHVFIVPTEFLLFRVILAVTATEQGGLCGSHFETWLGHRPVEEFYHGFAQCLRADAATGRYRLHSLQVVIH